MDSSATITVGTGGCGLLSCTSTRTAAEHRLEMTVRFTIWDHVTGSNDLPTAA
jgi:hypothetical protein